MKLSRIIPVIIFVVGAVALYIFWPKAPTAEEMQTNVTGSETEMADNGDTQAAGDKEVTTSTPTSTPTQVTSTKLSAETLAYGEYTGLVKANEQLNIFPTVGGQIASVNVAEGQPVKKGEVLFTISGTNGSKSGAQTQAEVAAANYETAKKSLNITIDGNAASLRAAELQLESARHQTQGAALDLQVFERNLEGAEDGLYMLNDTLYTTQRLNEMEQDNLASSIDDLQDAISDLEDQKYDTLRSLQDQINAAADPVQKELLQQELLKADTEMTAQLEDLYTKLDDARDGYDALIDGSTLKENQIFAQIHQAEAQSQALYLNQQGFAQKLGLSGDSSDGVRMAEEGVSAAKVRNQAAVAQAQLQLNLAKLNLESALAMADGLIVRAPFDGIIGEIMVQGGDLIGPQVLLTQVTGPKNFELKVGVDIETAEKIALGSMAEVKIGKRYIKMPIKSIAPVADASSKLVNITVALPKIFFRTNQTLSVRIPLAIHNPDLGDAGAGGGQTLFVPLDAVIIGTEEQHVFVVENGKAHRKTVTLGTINGSLAEILGGLEASDEVIVDGAKDLVEGQAVSI